MEDKRATIPRPADSSLSQEAATQHRHVQISSPTPPPSQQQHEQQRRPQQQQQQQQQQYHHQAGGGGGSSSSLRTIIDKQQQIIAGQAEMIETLGRELAHRAEELARCTTIKEEMERLVSMTERAEEEAGDQVAALESEVLRLTELLQRGGGGGGGEVARS